MKKVLSILLSAMLILSTMTVLMMLPASATTAGVAAITATEGGVVDTDSVTVGETATIVATPYFGNTFAGWFDSEGQLVSKQATYTGTITDSLTAKFNVLNQIVDGSFENGTAGQDYFNRVSGSAAGQNNVIADTPTPGNALHGDKVLACTPSFGTNTENYLLYMPLTVKKNTQYAFHMSFYMPTTSAWKYIGLYGNNSGYTYPWDAYGTLAAWSYDYCAESLTSGVAWRYAGNQSASVMFAKAMPDNTMGANEWQSLWILIDTGDDATIFPDGDTGDIYLSFGTLNNNTDTFYIDNVSFAEVTNTQATYTATAGEGGTVTADGDVASSLRSVCHYNTSGSVNGSAGSDNMVADSTRYSKSVTAVKKYTAVADEGYTFDGWYDDTDNLVSTNATAELLMYGNYTAKFAQPLAAGNGGVLADNGDGTVTAKPYYGNTFDGWYNGGVKLTGGEYDTDTVTADGKYGVTAKFNVYNQIVDGSFENGTAGQDYFNLYSGSNAGQNNTIAATPTPGNALHGDKVLNCVPKVASTTENYLLYIPVTVKKNTEYAFHLSYYMPTTKVFKYIGLKPNNSNYKNSWDALGTVAKWSMHWATEGATNESAWSYMGNQSASTIHARTVNANIGISADSWTDVWVLIDTGEDASIFDSGDTAEIWMTFGTVNNDLNNFYIDNVSFAEVSDTDTTGTATAGEGGSVTLDKELSSSLRPVLHFDTNGNGSGDAYNTHIVAGSTRYSLAKTAVRQYTATPDSGYAFAGWYNDSDVLVSTNATAELNMSGNYTAKFAQSVSAGEGGVLTDNGDGTVTAKPYYGNTFDGWYKGGVKLTGGEYDTDTVTAEGNHGVVAKFGVYNQIVDGSFESPDQAGVNYINANSPIGNGRGNVLRDLPSGSDAVLHGSKALYCKPTAVSTATQYIARYTVTVEKNKNYVFHYSYYDNEDPEQTSWMRFSAQAAKGNPGCWEQVGKPAWQAGAWKVESRTGYSTWPGYSQNSSALFAFGQRTGWNDKDSYKNNWVDAWYYFNAGEDSTVFADGEDTAQINLMIGHGNSNDFGFYLDNVSFTEAVNTPNGAVSATADVGGSVNAKTPISVDRLSANGENGTYTDNVIAGTTAYSNIAVTEYTAIPEIGYVFEGWYDSDGNCVSTDASTALYIPGTYTAKFTKSDSVGIGGFEDNIDPHYIATTKNGVTAELAAYSETEKALNGYNADLGDTYLKVTTPNNGSHTDISFPVNVTAGEKYVAHFKLFVSSSLAKDPENDEAGLDDSSRFDFRVTADAVSWGTPDFVSGDVSVANGKNIYNKTTVANGLFLVWFGQAAQSKYGDSIVDAYAVIEATGTGTIYLTAGLRNGGVYGIDNVTFVNVNDMAPTMVGATMNTGVEDGNEIMYVTNVNVPSYVALNKIATYMAPTTKLAAAYPERVSDFADDLGSDYVGTATLVANNRTGTIDVKGGATFRSGDVYSSFVGAAAVTQTNKYSVRSVISLTDAYGNDLGVSVATQNTNSASKIENGVYTRSIAQVKRLNAKYYIENGYDALAAAMITPVDDKALYNCDLAQVWEFVKEAAKQAAAN